MQSQIVCHGCRSVLRYPSGAPSVCCALCQAITTVPPPAPEKSPLIFNSISSNPDSSHIFYSIGNGSSNMWWLPNIADVYSQCRHLNNIAHVSCGQCRTTLMYPYGAPSVKCAICHYITNTGMNTMAPTPSPMPTSSGSSYNAPSTSVPTSRSQNVTVVVENPMTVDEKGKLVSPPKTRLYTTNISSLLN
uniref:Zinc finger LSD1-type domain-containing protein n=1 Tax=Leersia perrieri TaxID=77586 RepID=A0A0D9VWQ2_9ORYZ